ncbi:MAG: HAD family hydrolase [Bacteroidota bacterium]
MIKKYKHIIWDWNGTIFNDVELCVDLINELLEPRGLKTVTLAEYKNVFTIPVRDYYAELGFDFSKESFEVVGKQWMDEYERRKFECRLHDEVADVILRINKLGIGQSILSAYTQHTLEEMVEHFGLTKYFSHLVGLDNIYAAGKLHLGKDLMKRLGNGRGETLLIGDTLHDYEVASEIGADCVLIANGHQSREKLETSGAVVFENIEGLFS